jgi:hypothetical protein
MAYRGFIRFKDRSSYKTSDVVGLFIIGLILGALFCGMCVAIDYALQLLLGPHY